MKKTLLSVVLLSASAVVFQSCKTTKRPELKPIVPVIALLSTTGSWSDLGQNSSAALALAENDINNYLDAKNAKFNIVVYGTDTKLDTALTRQRYQAAAAQGIVYFIGPQSSAGLANIKPYIDKNKSIVISQSSTAGSLAIAGDGIFRFCPSDKVEGLAMANSIFKQGIKGLVTVARDDAGNKGLQTSVNKNFTGLGGTADSAALYSQTETNFATVIADLKTRVNSQIATYGVAKVGVYLAAFDEGVALLKAAAAEPVLKSVKWYGGDGLVLNTKLTADTTASNFAIATGFVAPSYGLPAAQKAKWQPIATNVKAQTKLDPDAFALVTYDILWTLARTIEKLDGATPTYETVKQKFAEEANIYDGITGLTTLNEFGDRANGDYDYFGIQKDGSTYKWVLKGTSKD